jgi:hypothetical protein
MGRGLSPLQTTILIVASRRDILVTAEVYQTLYGWTKHYVRSSRDRYEEWYGRWTWNVAAIGAIPYNRGAATVSRAIRRLVARGLLRPHISKWLSRPRTGPGSRSPHHPKPGARADSWALTPAGWTVLEQLSVKKQNEKKLFLTVKHGGILCPRPSPPSPFP